MAKVRTLFQSSIFLLLTIFILLAMHWLGWLRPVESVFVFISKPIVGGLHVINTKLGSGIELMGGISKLARDNGKLAAELEKAQGEIAQLSEIKSEVDSLRERLAAPLPRQMQTTMASVIGHDGIVAAKNLIINSGKEAGIEVGDAALSPEGSLIGRVSRVSKGSSEIMLITDDHSIVAARVAQSRVTGLLKGELGLGLKMTDIPQQDTVNEGDLVVTSGLAGDLPKGLAIGSIEAVQDEDNALFQVARLRPLASVVSLEFVHVVTSF